MRALPLLFTFLLLQSGCQVDTINYAQGEIRITKTSKIIVNNQPGVEVRVRNESQKAQRNFTVTAKAKRDHNDLDTARATVDLLQPEQSTDLVLIFKHLPDHSAYEFLTFAVSH